MTNAHFDVSLGSDGAYSSEVIGARLVNSFVRYTGTCPTGMKISIDKNNVKLIPLANGEPTTSLDKFSIISATRNMSTNAMATVLRTVDLTLGMNLCEDTGVYYNRGEISISGTRDSGRDDIRGVYQYNVICADDSVINACSGSFTLLK